MNSTEMKYSLSSKTFTLLLSLVLMCFVLPTRAADVLYKDVKYTLNYANHTAAASAPKDNYVKTLAIADSVADGNGVKFAVTSISASAFYKCQALTNVTFGNCLKSIGKEAFAECIRLTEAIIPEGVETLGEKAFYNCSSLLRVDVPSTVKSLPSRVFFTKSITEVVFRTAYYDTDGAIKGIPYNSGAFNNIKTTCTLFVPKKAEAWYRAQWGPGMYFEAMETFGTAPTGFSVTPSGVLESYRDLEKIDIKFNFPDSNQINILDKSDTPLTAALQLEDGTVINGSRLAVNIHDNTISISFAGLLSAYKDHFVAQKGGADEATVVLILDGELLVEDCLTPIKGFMGNRTISWTVPLLPASYELQNAPIFSVNGEPADKGYPYTALQKITMTFEKFDDVQLDSSNGDYIKARLYKDGKALCDVGQNITFEGKNVILPFFIPRSAVLVRHSEGIDSFEFTLELEGQLRMSDGKNYTFKVPFTAGAARPRWTVQAEYYPEPQDVIYTPGAGETSISALSAMSINLPGVSTVKVDNTSANPFAATLLMDGEPVRTIGAEACSIIGNTLHLDFAGVDERTITLITDDADKTFDFSIALSADLIVDSYDYHLQIDGNGSSWTAPHWTVTPIICDLPQYAVGTPLAGEDGPAVYSDLRTLEVAITNYDSIAFPANGTQTACIMRNGKAVAKTNAITIEGNKLILDFTEVLDFNAVGITPDDDPEVPVELGLQLEADLLFDGLPFHLSFTPDEAGTHWLLTPIVVTKLPAPTITFVDDRLRFECEVDQVTYHYTITNDDSKKSTTVTAEKTILGNTVTVPLKRIYVISVYATREGYEPSETTVAHLQLDEMPTIEYK